MLNISEAEPRARIRTIVRYLWLVPAVALLYVGWVFLSRWQDDRAVEQRIKEKERVEAERGFEMMGGNRFDILQFYASPGIIHRGETAQLCYGVSNATKVRLEPPAASVWPSLSRCVNVAPTQNTTYTLTIEDASGNTKTKSLVIQVR